SIWHHEVRLAHGCVSPAERDHSRPGGRHGPRGRNRDRSATLIEKKPMAEPAVPRLRFLRPAGARRRPRLRRGVYLLPSLLTMAHMFCGYACVVYAIRGEFETAAPFIGIAIVLDMLDGRIARMMGADSAFGAEFDSLADIISFGMAPAILA